MKNQALFSSKDKSKKLKSRLLQFLFGAFRVKISMHLLGPSAHVSAIANFKLVLPILRCMFRKSGEREDNETFRQHF